MEYQLLKILTTGNIPDKLLNSGEKIKFKRDEVLKNPDDNFEGAYILLKGLAVVRIISDKGQQVIRFILKPPCIMAELATITDNKSLSFFQFLEDSEVVYINRLELIDLIKKDSEICSFIFESLYKKFSFLISQSEGVIFLPADVKVAEVFYEFAMEFGEKFEDYVKINFNLKLELISDLVGINRSSVVRSISKLVENNIISHAGRNIVIKDLEVLKNYIDEHI